MKVLRKFIILVLIIAVLIFLADKYKVKEKILKKIYPTKYLEYVEKYSEENGVDKWLVYSIIKAESNFDPNVKSNSGAIGLMQLMLETAKELDSNITEEELFTEEKNIELGVKYFNKLLNYYNNINLAILAYNAGIGNVDNWIESGIINKEGTNLENVPFKETNNYARKILRDYEIYKSLY